MTSRLDVAEGDNLNVFHPNFISSCNVLQPNTNAHELEEGKSRRHNSVALSFSSCEYRSHMEDWAVSFASSVKESIHKRLASPAYPPDYQIAPSMPGPQIEGCGPSILGPGYGLGPTSPYQHGHSVRHLFNNLMPSGFLETALMPPTMMHGMMAPENSAGQTRHSVGRMISRGSEIVATSGHSSGVEAMFSHNEESCQSKEMQAHVAARIFSSHDMAKGQNTVLQVGPRLVPWQHAQDKAVQGGGNRHMAMMRSLEYAAQGHASMTSQELTSHAEELMYIEAMNAAAGGSQAGLQELCHHAIATANTAPATGLDFLSQEEAQLFAALLCDAHEDVMPQRPVAITLNDAALNLDSSQSHHSSGPSLESAAFLDSRQEPLYKYSQRQEVSQDMTEKYPRPPSVVQATNKSAPSVVPVGGCKEGNQMASSISHPSNTAGCLNLMSQKAMWTRNAHLWNKYESSHARRRRPSNQISPTQVMESARVNKHMKSTLPEQIAAVKSVLSGGLGPGVALEADIDITNVARGKGSSTTNVWCSIAERGGHHYPHGSKAILMKRQKLSTKREPLDVLLVKLENELKSKLKLSVRLAEENKALEAKMKVYSKEAHIGGLIVTCKPSQGIAEAVRGWAEEFQNPILQSKTESSLPKDGKDFSLANFQAVWRTLYQQLSIWISPAGPSKASQELQHRMSVITNCLKLWVSSVSLNRTLVMCEAYVHNMETGQPLERGAKFWLEVVKKLSLSHQQVGEFQDGWDLHHSVLQSGTVKQAELQLEICSLLDERGRRLSRRRTDMDDQFEDGTTTENGDSYVQLEDWIQEYDALYRKVNSLDYFIIGLVAEILTPWQLCACVVHSYPSFPSMKGIFKAAASLKASRQ
ncbi:hypothetical protein CEUSTIGMA_g9875.t1 [Chlamydomonas eustigma]|uniref:Uncharacterized protein n=1 Tax=Chlamydomonas eustigma TaxID=1157962 RepID=A0A250XH99_9CHLO|nr:hypothetical protein CEUSTIGMA_g9875.t1 [Chlamydomonas eustigma]|eukprot:GAX82448.1 hypothetical protein CEUSTIGMA_g9875.t1 [Chlamydomonas eustigma]